MSEQWTHGETVLNGVRFHYVEAGAPDPPLSGDDRELVVLLHGFPEFWYAWHRQIPRLAAAGYHVVAPDMRGYNRTEAPPNVADYDVEHLVSDVAALVRDHGYDRAHVVGHDWGGVVAWEVGLRDPHWLDRLAVLNAPHPAAYDRELRAGTDQLLRSWYAVAFQVPWVPETVLHRGADRLFERVFPEDASSPDAFSAADVARYREAFADRETCRAAIDYYRALFRRRVRERAAALPGVRPPHGPSPETPIEAPTLLLWGVEDRALSPRLTTGLERWVPDLRVERFPDASHWVQADAPERVAAELIGFLDAA
jgi:pimeloyl-ACP methyl ester carboxylesterase